MGIGELRRARDRTPFRPFLVRRVDGGEIRASRPEHIARDVRSRTAVCRPGRAWEAIDIDQITSPGDAPASPSSET
jgi:hypothetical protein